MEKQKIQITVPANLKYSAFVRHIAGDVFAIAKFCSEWCNRLKLVADELFMNAVKYGSTTDKSFVYITFFYDEDGVQFIIEDDGTGTAAVPAEKLEEIIQQNEKNTNLSRTSGRGLSMITKVWTDEMIVGKSEYGGISVSIMKKIEVAPPAIQPIQLTGLVKQAVDQISTPAEPTNEPTPVTKPSGTSEKSKIYEIKVSGEIDQTNIDEIVAPISYQVHEMPAGSTLLLDFADAKYINSMFIGNLAGWYTSLNSKKGHVQLKNMNHQVEEVLKMVGLLEVLENRN